MTDFARFDQRHYPTVDARAGYAQWAPTYEDTVEDMMDLALLDRLDSVPWHDVTRAADLGCGSGRTAQWLRTRGPFPIDGVDLTPEMLDLARRRGIHATLVEADLRATGLPAAAYDLAVLRYREGVGNYLQVLTTEDQLLVQQRLAAELKARRLDLAVTLIGALGGGFEESTEVLAHSR